MELQHKPRQSYKFLLPIGMFYLMVLIVNLLTSQKIIDFPFFGIITLSILLSSPLFIMSDIIAEVYGYRACQKLVIFSLSMAGLFSCIMVLISKINSPQFFISWAAIQDPNAYQFMFGNLLKNFLAIAIGYFIAISVNTYFISKWKILLKGHYFWLRSIASSGIGALIFTIIGTLIIGYPALEHHQADFLIKIILASFLIKIVSFIILAYPATLICIILKKIEGVDVYDYGVNYNPFKLPKK